MEYRIILTKNKKKIKILHKYKTNKNALNKFNEIINNNIVYFPKLYTNTKKIAKVQYELLLIREKMGTDEYLVDRDEMGKLKEIKCKNDKWLIINRVPYYFEETFWVFGYCPKHERFSIRDILKKILLKDIAKKNYTMQIILVRNKLIFQDFNDIQIVICKCPEDAGRLHDALYKSARTTRMDKLLFMGRAKGTVKTALYKRIQEKTGWGIKKLYRPTTRH